MKRLLENAMQKASAIVKFFNSNDSAMATNDVVTPHQPVCLYSATRGEGELPGRSNSLSGGPSDAWNIIIISRQRAQGRCFWTSGIPKPSCFLRIELVMKNNLAPRMGYYWGSSSPSKVL
jgi:hypothetical protein